MRVQLQRLRELRRCNKKTAGIPMLKKVRDTGFFSVMCSADGATTNAERGGSESRIYS